MSFFSLYLFVLVSHCFQISPPGFIFQKKKQKVLSVKRSVIRIVNKLQSPLTKPADLYVYISDASVVNCDYSAFIRRVDLTLLFRRLLKQVVLAHRVCMGKAREINPLMAVGLTWGLYCKS